MPSSLRFLFKRPLFAFVTIATLALGIGANTAIFSVVHAILIRPFPYPDQERIVIVSGKFRDQANSSMPLNYPDLQDFKRESNAFEALGGSQDAQFVVTGVQEPARVKGAFVNPSVISLLGVGPVLGRLLQDSDDMPGAARVCLLGDRAWERFFGRRLDVIGKAINLDGNSYEVVGVLPPGFKFWNAWAYVPMVHGVPPEFRTARGVRNSMWGIGRLKPGTNPEAAAKQLDGIARNLEAAHPVENRNVTVTVRALSETVGDQLRPTLWMLFGAVACVLLISCVNVTNLLLAAGAARERELAVRMALGAGRWVVFRQLLIETLPIGILAAVAGLLLAAGGIRLILSLIPENLIPAESTVELNLPVLLFTVVVGILTSLVAGVIPALRASRLEAGEALKQGGRSAGGGHGSQVRNSLIVAEVALAFALLVGAGLLIRNLVGVMRTDPGFRVDKLLVAFVQLPEAKYPDPGRALNVARELAGRIKSFPSVLNAGVLGAVPMQGGSFSVPLLQEGRVYAKEEEMRSVACNAATPGGIEAIGLKLLEGRLFTEADRAGSERVAILNARAARLLFGAESAIGKRVASGVPRTLFREDQLKGVFAALADPPFARVVGVVSDSRQYALTFDPQPEVYYPMEQSLPIPFVRNNFCLAIHSTAESQSLIPFVRKALRDLDPDLPLETIRTMDALVEDTLRSQRFVVLLLGMFAGLALLLSGIGIYSVMSWLVSQRTQEMGIRMALGATEGGMIGLVVGQGTRPVLLGLLIGCLLAMSLSGFLATQLINMTTNDAPTYAAVSILLLGIAWIACWIPARRASRVDPMVALRSE